MGVNLEKKQKVVTELLGVAEGAYSVVAAEYRGLASNDLNSLRQMARERGIYLKVFKNTLAKIALKDTQHACLNDDLTGPIILGFSVDGPSDAAKLFKEFAKDHELLQVKALTLGNKRLSAEQIEIVASLPTLEEALAMLMSCLQAPTRKLATACQETYGRLARVLQAYADQQSA